MAPRNTEEVLEILRAEPTQRYLFRGFGPLGIGLILALVMVLLSPSIAPERIVTTGGAGGGPDVPLAGGGATGDATADAGESGSSVGDEPGASDSSGATDAGTGAGSNPDAGASDGTGGISVGTDDGRQNASGVQPCADRQLQIPSDPYSPPCFSFSGDNGGATWTGVTEDEIVVTVRMLEGPTAGEIFADISGQPVVTSREAYENTMIALADYFSQRFQFYGRTIRLEIFDGQGNGSDELLGGGIEGALADAVQAKERGAFADVSAITTPYADAIARQEIIGIGAPYPSSAWYTERRPYAWSLFPDGTLVSEIAVDNAVARLSGQETAEYAGADLRGKPRVYGILAPENAEYKESVERYVSGMEDAGFGFAVDMRYKLDINSMPNQASNIVAQMKDAGVTTIVCACDPVMLALGLAPKANEQDWEPEWLTGGLAFMDQDMVAQLVDARQWQHAFGIAFNSESEPQGRSFPYAAYKSVRPEDEPAFGVEEMYYGMYILALGIHLAGPNLTPDSFEAGLFSYPGASGPKGFWSFGPGDYTPTDDVREIWWDPDKVSSQNNKKGAWVELNGGKRYFRGQFPQGPAPYFEEG